MKETICIDRETVFTIDELFFSTTDLRGVIQAGNDVFIRVSGFTEDELIGYAHSKVRHPDMPSSVFRVFWDMLHAGKSVAAYVKNLAKDGCYYWVMAMVTPFEGGYLSVRLKPSSDVAQKIIGIYQRVQAEEKLAESEGASKEERITRGLSVLMQELASLGFNDYESFMKYALAVETASRESIRQPADEPEGIELHQRTKLDPSMLAIIDLSVLNWGCDRLMSQMLQRLKLLQDANEEFLASGTAMSTESKSISMIALNAGISSKTPPLVEISRELAAAESDSRQAITRMNESVASLSESLAGFAFDVSVAALQSEIASHFLSELRTASAADQTEILQRLLSLSCDRLEVLCTEIDKATEWFHELKRQTEDLSRGAKRLQFIRMSGVTESAYLESGHSFVSLFDKVDQSIKRTQKLCSNVDSQSLVCESAMAELVSLRTEMRQCLFRIKSKEKQLSTRALQRSVQQHDRASLCLA